MSASSWNLELQFKEAERLPKMQRSVPFNRIMEDITAGMNVLCCHLDSIKETRYSRVAYCVRIEEDLFDLFFNSSNGYRAAYFRSPWEGMSTNAAFLDAVMHKLLGSKLTNKCGLNEEFVRESLRTPSAKVWLTERGKEVKLDCIACRGEWSVRSAGDLSKPEIRNGIWDRAQDLKGKWGSTAPYLTKLRILGAFLDEDLNELVPFNKRFRAQEIHEFGWS